MIDMFIKALDDERKKIEADQGNWGLRNVQKLNNLLEENNIFISSSLWDLLLFNIRSLYCSEGKISISWRGNQSKKVIKLIQQNYSLIVENYEIIK